MNARPSHPKGPNVGRSLPPPHGMANFLLTWLPRVPRLWYRVSDGGSQLLSGLGIWPGQLWPGMQQTEGETSAVWSLGLDELADSFSPETWGGGGEMEAGKQWGALWDSPAPLLPRNMHSYTPYGRTRAMQTPAWPLLMVIPTPEPPGARLL